MISDGAIRFRLTNNSTAAAATDTYVPADTPVIIASRNYKELAWSQAGTFIQIVEVQ